MKKIRYYGLCTILLLSIFSLCGCEKKETVLITNPQESEGYQEKQVLTELSQLPDQENIEGKSDEEHAEAGENETRLLLVHICGAVAKPGVYELNRDARFFHAVEAAGGFEHDADTEYLNMAQALSDGMKIYVPTKEESAALYEEKYAYTDVSSLMKSESQETADERIDINKASKSELCNLPGIGEAKAQNIVAYREKIGKYHSIEEVMNVEGIKEALFEKIKDSIKVSE